MSKVKIVMYHYVRVLKNSRYPQIKGLDYTLFEQQLDFFKTKNYHFITIEELLAAYEENYNLPDKSVLLTFDDGYIDHFTNVFPILKENHIRGAFYIPGKTFCEDTLLDVNKIHFILASTKIHALLDDLYHDLEYYRNEFSLPTNEELFQKYALGNRFDCQEIVFIKTLLQNVLPEELRHIILNKLFKKYIGLPENIFAKELYMNLNQIKCMQNSGMYIGLHGYDHYWLGEMPKEKAQKDIDKAILAMAGIINTKSWQFSYPYSSYNEDIIKYLKTKGCRLAMTADVREADTEKDSQFLLPRLDTNDFPPKSDNWTKL